MGNIVDAVLRMGQCSCRSCGWLHRFACSVHPPSSHSIPSPPTHPPDFILHHFPPSFFTSSFTLVQTHSTHVLSPAFSFFSPHFSQTPSHPLTRLITFLLHHFSYVYYGASCVPDRDLTLFRCPFPFLPLSEMSPCRRDVQPLKQTALRGVRFHTTHRHGMLWQASMFVFLRADVFRKMRTGTSQKTRRCDDEIGKFWGVSDGKTNLKVGIVC